MTMRFLFVMLLFAFAGCDKTDPYLREGTWRPTGANEANLRAMVVVPSDLVRATPATAADGGLAAAAVDRLRHDRVRPLPDSAVLDVVPVNAGSSAQQAPAAPAGSN
jgi:hypothetical protein